MDSTHTFENFYLEDEKIKQDDSTKAFIDQGFGSLGSLDPSFEDSIDLQHLIASTIGEGSSHSSLQLFPDLPEVEQTSLDTSTVLHLPEEESMMPSEQVIHITENSTIKEEPILLEVPLEGVVGGEIEAASEYAPSTVSLDDIEGSTEVTSYNAPSVGGRRPAPGKAPRKGRKRAVNKESDEYKERRERNNVAVRKSRDKAKLRQSETEQRVTLLTTENERLNKKCDLLSKELSVLKGLFSNVGASLPREVREFIAKQ